MDHMDSFYVEATVLGPQGVVPSINDIICGKMAITELLFHLWVVEVVVRGCHIRIRGQICNQFKVKYVGISHGCCRHVSWGTVLVEKHPSGKLSMLNLLDFLPWLSQELNIVGPGDSGTNFQLIYQHHSCIPEMVAITLLVDIIILAFLGFREPGCFHCFCCSLSLVGSDGLRSVVTNCQRKTLYSGLVHFVLSLFRGHCVKLTISKRL